MKYVQKIPKNEIDEILRGRFNGMIDGEIFTVRLVSGFEEFGAYENWGKGWVVDGKGPNGEPITCSDARIEIAVKRWLKKYDEAKSR